MFRVRWFVLQSFDYKILLLHPLSMEKWEMLQVEVEFFEKKVLVGV